MSEEKNNIWDSRFTISFTQSSKGFFYLKEAKIRADLPEILEKDINDILIIVNNKLAELNKEGK